MRTVLILLLFLCVAACSQDRPANLAPSQTTANLRADIGKAVKEFWAQERPNNTVQGLSFQRYSETIYLVGVTFEGEGADDPATNTIVRQFEEADGRIVWKAERLSRRWKSVLRLEPDE